MGKRRVGLLVSMMVAMMDVRMAHSEADLWELMKVVQ